MDSEKQTVKAQPSSSRRVVLFLILVVVNTVILGAKYIFENHPVSFPENPDGVCPLVPKLNVSAYGVNESAIEYILKDEKYRELSASKLLGAIRFPTEMYGGLEPDGFVDDLEAEDTKSAPLQSEDKKTGDKESEDKTKELESEMMEQWLADTWKPFYNLHEYFTQEFPLVHKYLELTKVNKAGLVYTWKGLDESKSPILLAAHQDVVPVVQESVDQWKYPPFDGHYDGKYVYGRGACDCKNLLVGLFESAELLLQNDFKPTRTIVFAFGYDEETDGRGARHILDYLVEKYGEDSFVQIIDEGSSGLEVIEGINMVVPDITEKGYLDSNIELHTKGGHLSVPPDHTAIGIMARLLVNIEDVQFSSRLTNVNPVLKKFQCAAEHSTLMKSSLKSSFLRADKDKTANAEALEYLLGLGGPYKYSLTTSQSIDIIYSGMAPNEIPEYAFVDVNHRIAVEESVASTSSKILDQVKDIAKKYKLGVVYNGKEVIAPTELGHFEYKHYNPLEPAPVSPTNGGSWNIFAGALRYLFEEHITKGETTIVAPGLGIGNTDTKSYWSLSRNIFRHVPGDGDASGAHTVNERQLVDSHLQAVAFYYYYLQVVDQLKDEEFN